MEGAAPFYPCQAQLLVRRRGSFVTAIEEMDDMYQHVLIFSLPYSIFIFNSDQAPLSIVSLWIPRFPVSSAGRCPAHFLFTFSIIKLLVKETLGVV